MEGCLRKYEAEYLIGWNFELYELYGDNDLAQQESESDYTGQYAYGTERVLWKFLMHYPLVESGKEEQLARYNLVLIEVSFWSWRDLKNWKVKFE